jgi:hypothetical protein
MCVCKSVALLHCLLKINVWNCSSVFNDCPFIFFMQDYYCLVSCAVCPASSISCVYLEFWPAYVCYSDFKSASCLSNISERTFVAF